jgi:hypothetical protein
MLKDHDNPDNKGTRELWGNYFKLGVGPVELHAKSVWTVQAAWRTQQQLL